MGAPPSSTTRPLRINTPSQLALKPANKPKRGASRRTSAQTILLFSGGRTPERSQEGREASLRATPSAFFRSAVRFSRAQFRRLTLSRSAEGIRGASPSSAGTDEQLG